MNLDQIGGLLCAIIAGGAFYLHAASDPARKSWITLPRSVRLGFALVGMTVAVKSTDFFSIADKTEALGHTNLLGVLSWAAIAYLVIAGVVCVGRNRLRGRQWDRLQEVEQTCKSDPEVVPAAIHRQDAPDVLRALGANVNGED